MPATTKQIEKAYAKAIGLAEGVAPTENEIRDAAMSAAGDSVMWAIKNLDEKRVDSFPGFAFCAAKRFVGRAVRRATRRLAMAPCQLSALLGPDDSGNTVSESALEQLGDLFEGEGLGEAALSVEMSELPDSLAFVVRLFYIDKFSVRDISLLSNIGKSTVCDRLRKAARLLRPEGVIPVRKPKAKRMIR